MRDGMRSDQIKGNWIGGKCVKEPINIGAQIKINFSPVGWNFACKVKHFRDIKG
jgi:hypothetical protein